MWENVYASLPENRIIPLWKRLAPICIPAACVAAILIIFFQVHGNEDVAVDRIAELGEIGNVESGVDRYNEGSIDYLADSVKDCLAERNLSEGSLSDQSFIDGNLSDTDEVEIIVPKDEVEAETKGNGIGSRVAERVQDVVERIKERSARTGDDRIAESGDGCFDGGSLSKSVESDMEGKETEESFAELVDGNGEEKQVGDSEYHEQEKGRDGKRHEPEKWVEIEEFVRQQEMRQRRKRGVTLLASASSSAAMESQKEFADYKMFYSSGVVSDLYASGVGEGDCAEVFIQNNGKDVSSSMEHAQPLRVEVGVEFPLSDRWAIESGITYSLLSSRVVSGTDQSNYSIRQNLHYVGVPLNLNFYFAQLNPLSFYLSAGAMAEKCVWGNSVTSYNYDINSSSRNSRISEKQLQWSTSFSAGLSLRFLNHFSFFLEPGVTYAFDNGSPVDSYYKDKPLGFNVSLGLRFRL